VIILLLLLALLGGAEDPPNVQLEVVISENDSPGVPLPPNSGLPGPPPFGWRAFWVEGLFGLEGEYRDIWEPDRPRTSRDKPL
jgi:hypothetical protein